MKKSSILFLTLSMIFTTSVFYNCAKDKGKAPSTGNNNPGTGGSACDTVTYTKHIGPLLATKCTMDACHPANLAFTNYSEASQRADRIKARAVDHQPSQMPPSSSTVTPLTDAQKQLITCWLSNGKKEN